MIDVEPDHLQLVLELGLADEVAADADAGVGRQHVDWSAEPGKMVVEHLRPIEGRQVHREGLDLADAGGTEPAQRLGRLAQVVGVLGGYDQVVTVLGELAGELEADAAGAAGHHRQGAKFGHDAVSVVEVERPTSTPWPGRGSGHRPIPRRPRTSGSGCGTRCRRPSRTPRRPAGREAARRRAPVAGRAPA